MAEPFKNLIHRELVARVAARLHQAGPGFDRKRFTELAAEGRARRMQFEHYRDALCVFANGPVVGEAKA